MSQQYSDEQISAIIKLAYEKYGFNRIRLNTGTMAIAIRRVLLDLHDRYDHYIRYVGLINRQLHQDGIVCGHIGTVMDDYRLFDVDGEQLTYLSAYEKWGSVTRFNREAAEVARQHQIVWNDTISRGGIMMTFFEEREFCDVVAQADEIALLCDILDSTAKMVMAGIT